MKPAGHANRRAGLASGFTLLEAIVALTVIGIAMLPVMSFLAQATRQLSAAADSNRRVFAQQAVMAFSEAMNPLATPDGETQLSPNLTVRWISTPIAAPNEQSRLGGRLGGYRIGFYAVEFTLVQDQQDWFSFTARKIGYEPRSVSLTGLPP